MKIKVCLILILISFQLSLTVMAQHTVSGKIMEAGSREAIPGAHILLNNQLMTVSDAQGKFSFSADASTQSSSLLIVTAIGFEPYKTTLNQDKKTKELIIIFLKPSVKELEELVIMASRSEQRISDIPGRVELLSRERISLSASASIDESLSMLTGVHTGRSFGLFSHRATVSMRGVSGKEQARTLVLLDGIPLNKADGGSVNWNLISSGETDRVEVVKGPGSALYGGNAMGGVINIVSRKPVQPIESSFSAIYGTYQTRGFRARIGGKSGDFFWMANGLWRASNGYITQSDQDQQNNPHIIKSNFDEKNASLRLGYSKTPLFEADVTVSLFDDRRGTGEKVFQPEGNTTDYDTYSVRSTVKGRNGNTSWNAGLFFIHEKYKRVSEWFRDDYTWYDVLSNRKDYGLMTGLHHKLGAHLISAGLDVRAGSVDASDIYYTSTDQVDNRGRNIFYGLYIQDQLTFFDQKLQLVAGMRLDYSRFSDGAFVVQQASAETIFMHPFVFEKFPTQNWTALSPRISVQYKPDNALRLYSSFGKGFRPAVLDDLCRSGRVRGGFKVANPELKPENIYSLELGADWKPLENARFSISTYFSKGNDFLYYVSTGDSIDMGFGLRPVMIRSNISGVQIAGFELEALYTVNSTINLMANYAFNQSLITAYDAGAAVSGVDLTGKFLTDVPFHAFNAGVIYRSDFVDASATAKYTGRMYVNDQNVFDDIIGGNQYKPVLTFDIKLKKNIGNSWFTGLSIQNILNEKIFESRGSVGPGRFILLEVGAIIGR